MIRAYLEGYPMRPACGVDGCKGGWICISKNLDSGLVAWHLYDTAHRLMYQEPRPQVIAIDIPIGLPDKGPRTCELEARKLVGPGRAPSIFPAPIRPVLVAASYREACQIRYSIEKRRLSIQTWAIVPKIIDTDSGLRHDSSLRQRVHEVHPEVCFSVLAKEPTQHSKETKAGQAERLALLEPIFGHWLGDAIAARCQLASAMDDVLDAFVALWTAERIIPGLSQTIPPTPPQDSCGLRMEMVA
jgi:predicted RNase H-like nuclease